MHKFPNNSTNPEERLNMKMEREKAIMRDQLEPRDTFKIAYLIHFLLGVGNLLPWNASITAVDYFGYLYPTKHVEKVFSVAYMTSSVLLLVLMIAWDGWSKKTSFRFRMNLGFSLFILSILVSPIMDWASSMTGSNWRPNEAYGVIVASVVACGLADGLVAGSLIGSAGRLPKQFMQAVFAGTASSGVLVSILRIITKALLTQSPKGLQKSAHLYFIVGASILFCCIVSCNLLCKLPVMQHYYRELLDEPPCSKSKFWIVVGKIRWPAFGIFITYVVTLSIFPGFIAEDLESKLLQDWYPILLITIYNIADLVGKSLTAIYILKNIKKATWFCITRLLFYPLFMACIHGPRWLKTELPVIVLTFLLGLSNGYLTSVIMISTPKLLPASEAELSAIVMVVFLGIGLVGGSILGWFWIL
ncbi:equilibrative nucleotide transporter 8 [Benincasa hispida]|uniref:equilibrative nucleotide transporter 8 n=1 Tax=Benincasa hispida TaxID=102211 RepID=UPI00190024DD|nr:equilibrative nucleotide transporter 8 [Benincasa hispida]